MYPWRRVLLAAPAALPGAGVLALSAAWMGGEYYQPVYLAGGAVLLVAGALAALLLARLPWFGCSRLRAGLCVFAAVLAGWLAALLVMGALNLTPLCVGTESGDGPNNLRMCMVYTVLWAVFYTPPLGVGAALCGGLAALVYRLGDQPVASTGETNE